MSVSISVFLFLYYAFLVGWSIFALVSVYHMLKFGVKSFTTIFSTLLFLGVSAAIIFISFQFINQIDWGVEFTIFDNTVNFKEIKF